MKAFLVAFAAILSSSAFASGPRIGTRGELQTLLDALPSHQKITEATPCGFAVGGESLSLFVGEIDNSGQERYTLVSRCGGSASVDAIKEVYAHSGDSFTPLHFDQVLQKNGLDGSKLPMHIASPFLTQEKGKVVMHFKSPMETWVWEKDRLSKVR